MKTLIKFFMVMAVLCMAACSQTFEDVSNNTKSQEKAQGRLVMNVDKSRTIMPSFSENDIKSATLTANGTEIKSWNGAYIINQIENDNSILLDVGIYDFVMVFYKENGDMFLIGTINDKTITTEENFLIFDMKMATSNGNIAIKLSWETDIGINKIKAGLYNITTGETVENYESEELTINGTQSTYSKDNVPAGQYIIKFEVYDTSDKLLNTLTDVIKVIGGMITSDQKVLSKINTQYYTITYNLAGGSWQSGFTPVTVRNANTEIILPTSENIRKTNCMFRYWCDENGNKITQISSNIVKDITVTAKWVEYPQEGFVYVQGATITGAITAEGYTTSSIFKSVRSIPVGDFYICDHEVTQAEYKKYCSYGGAVPSDTYGKGDNYPAYYVSWFDALVYCNKRSIAEGLTPCYAINTNVTNPDDWGAIPTASDSSNIDKWYAVTCDFTANGYRLPTKAEWEYAARGGNGLSDTQYKYAGSDTLENVAWYTDNANSKIHAVKGREANGLGLYDMSGNVWEWCWDSDGSDGRYVRGGSWSNSADYCTVSSGSYNYAYNRGDYYGFRVVRTVDFFTSLIGYIAYSDGSISEEYDSTKTPIGIVIEVSDEGVATKIVSFTETYAKWSTKKIVTNATSTTDGAANMTTIKAIDGWETEYPAFEWCDDYTDDSGNSQWYLPAKGELDQLYAVKYYVNRAIEKITAGEGSATKLGINNCYWSSSQYGDSNAWDQSFSDGYQGKHYKNNTNSVRAVRAF